MSDKKPTDAFVRHQAVRDGRAVEALKNKADHDASIVDRDANTARLKALRLDRDRDDAAAAAAAPPPAPKIAKSRRTSK